MRYCFVLLVIIMMILCLSFRILYVRCSFYFIILLPITYYITLTKLYKAMPSDAIKWFRKFKTSRHHIHEVGRRWETRRSQAKAKIIVLINFIVILNHRVAWTILWEVLIKCRTHTFSTFTNWQHWKIVYHISVHGIMTMMVTMMKPTIYTNATTDLITRKMPLFHLTFHISRN